MFDSLTGNEQNIGCYPRNLNVTFSNKLSTADEKQTGIFLNVNW